MSEAYDFLIKERGILPATLEAWGVEDRDNGVRFPYANGAKIRHHGEDGKRSFRSESGTILGLFGEHVADPDQRTAFVVEGETDALRLWQALADEDYLSHPDVYGLPGVEAWRDEYKSKFDRYETVYVVLDNDEDYKVQARVDRCWLAIRRSLGPKAHRIILPDGVNDVCEFFDNYDLDALRLLAESESVSAWHFEALDLLKDPAPPDWLVQDLICKGDITMMIGEPSVGKSWLSMSLAVAVAENHSRWLGRRLDLNGSRRVLYVDEENPEALIPWRLRRLGLSDEGAKNIRYLHQQRVRLDKNPEALINEALDWRPELIVLDSLTRIHTRDENSAGEISALFNDGIVPLARDTGATTLVLHHVNKSDSGSSFVRARGSGDITAAPDCGLDVIKLSNGGFSMLNYKSRWIAEGQRIRGKIEDMEDGSVELVLAKEAVF